MNSALYDCRIMHQRLAPTIYRFEHSMHMFLLDLDEIDWLPTRIPWIQRNRFGLYGFYDRDHLPMEGTGTIRSNLSEWLETQSFHLGNEDRVLLLTSLRMLGYVFNPVSFYFISDRDWKPRAVVAEVSNTFREMKPYLITAQNESQVFEGETRKDFYVSPFMDVEDSFAFRIRTPDEKLALQIDTQRSCGRMLVSTLTGNRLPLTSRNILIQTLKYPFVTGKVIFLIHFHALMLLLKGVRLHWKHEKRERQQRVFNPHQTLRKR